MMGPEKLRAIRAEIRRAFKVSDAELFAWFIRQLDEPARKPRTDTAVLDGLRLLRDALLNETKRTSPRREAAYSGAGRR